mgnify:CR=1 FL=1
MKWWLKSSNHMFNHLKDAVSWIETRIKFRPKTDLIRMADAYKLLGVDLKNIKKIHIAGTNGKGSVASFMTHILMEDGYKVGTFTSPYLVRFNERIKVNFEDISDHDLLELINIIYDFNQTYEKTFGEPLAFFELLTLMSFLYFKKENVDYMVMEVGLGGLLDATNVLNYDLSLITSIGFDHMKQLGNTLESIAFNKLGILKPGNHLITTVDPSLHTYFKDYLKDMDVTYDLLTLDDIKILSYEPVSFIFEDVTYTLSLIGEYQFLNALLAIKASFYLFRDLEPSIIQKALLKAKWAGRLEKMAPNIYIDGAHNTHAILALKETVLHTFKDHHIYVLYSALGDKDSKSMLDIIRSFSHKIMMTRFPDVRFLDLKPYLEVNDLYFEDVKDALSYFKKIEDPKKLLLITGSLHFVGYIKQNEKILF